MSATSVKPRHRSTLSREWMRHDFNDREPFCEWPWHDLFVNLSNDTRVCCSFFTKLQPFDWPTAQDFHKETGMWNSPFMQHMRKNMGTPEEVPFCTVCLTVDKRAPANKQRVAEATKESLELYRSLQAKPSLHGAIDAVEIPLEDWQITRNGAKDAQPIKPFNASKHIYREMVQRWDFIGKKKVLLVGLERRAMAPFLAEMNDHIYLADFTGKHITATQLICHALGLDNVSASDLTGVAQLPYDDASFDAIWIDARALVVDRPWPLLPELRRVLSQDGTLHLHESPGPGLWIEKFIAGDMSHGDLVDNIARGPRIEDLNAFVTRQSLETILVKADLKLDRSAPPRVVRYSSKREGRLFEDFGIKAIARSLQDPAFLDRLRTDPAALIGLEKRISFNAIKKPLKGGGEAGEPDAA